MNEINPKPAEPFEPAAIERAEPAPVIVPEVPKLVEPSKPELQVIPEGYIWDNSSGCFKKNGP